MLQNELFVARFKVALREVTPFKLTSYLVRQKFKAVSLSRTADQKKKIVRSSLEKNLASGRPFVHRICLGTKGFSRVWVNALVFVAGRSH